LSLWILRFAQNDRRNLIWQKSGNSGHGFIENALARADFPTECGLKLRTATKDTKPWPKLVPGGRLINAGQLFL
jgi:hypothetical protein